MELMQANGASTKILGDMVGGKTAFDAMVASEAIGALTGNANLITEKFGPEEDDPVSEAKPEIWTNWYDFTNKAEALFKAALQADVSSLEGPQSSMGNIGGTCKTCHLTYRE